MKTCILHFGMAKTGSSSIQSTLLRASASDAFHYLTLGNGNAGRALATAFMPKPRQFRPNRKQGLSDEDLRERKAEVLAQLEQQFAGPQPRVIVSTEMLTNFDAATLTGLRDWLMARVDAVRLIGYVREPASFIESMFQQSLKNGNSHFDLARRYPGYRSRFEPLEQIFGRDHVSYRRFDPRRFPSQCVVRDFLSAIDLSLPESDIRRINEGLSREAVGLLYAYRQIHPKFEPGAQGIRRNRRLIRLLAKVPGDKLKIEPSLLREVVDAQADDLAWVSERLDSPLRPSYAVPGMPVIASEHDLLRHSEATLSWLRQRLGARHAPGADEAMDPARLAEVLDAYLDRVARKTAEVPPTEPDAEPDADGADDISDEGDAGEPDDLSGVDGDRAATPDEPGTLRLDVGMLARRIRDAAPDARMTEAQCQALVAAALDQLRQACLSPGAGLELVGLGQIRQRGAAADGPSDAAVRLQFRVEAATRPGEEASPDPAEPTPTLPQGTS